MGDTIHQNPDILDRVDFPFFCYSYDLLACLNGKSRPFLSRNEYMVYKIKVNRYCIKDTEST